MYINNVLFYDGLFPLLPCTASCSATSIQIVRVSNTSGNEYDTGSTCSSDYETADEEIAEGMPVIIDSIGMLPVLPLTRQSLDERFQSRGICPESGTSDGEVELAVEKESEAPANTSCNFLNSTVKAFLYGLRISKRPQSTLSRFSDGLRARYAKYPLPHHSNPQCRKWMPHVSKEYIHPDIISRDIISRDITSEEEQKEQLNSRNEAIPPWIIKDIEDTGKEFWEDMKDDDCSDTEQGSDTDGSIDDKVHLGKLLEARSGENCKCVLVEGGPGMGKSTLAWQVCHRWGKGELFDQYSTVLLLPLRDERVQQAKHVEDLLFYLDDKVTQRELIQEIGTGKDMLVILDGLDELPSHILSKQSIFTDLVSGEVLSDATVLVTSRPSATQQLLTCWKQRFSKHFIIRGFNEGNIEEYIKSILSAENLKEFQKHLSIHPHIWSIMYVPLHSAIVMAVYLQHKQLPKTRTQLYMALVEIILSQYLDDHQEYSDEEEVSCATGLKLYKTVHVRFIELCKIALDTVCKQELIFTEKTLPEALHDLSFTDSVPGLYMHRTCSYNFLHFSIQEFLAAYHVSLLSPQEQEQLLLRSREEHHIQDMMIFVAGITKFEGIRKEAVKQVVVVVNDTSTNECRLDNYSVALLYESKNVTVLEKEDTYSVGMCLFTPLWLALGYCIANSKCTWKLQIWYKFVDAQMLLQGLQDCKTQPAYTIKSIDCFFFIVVKLIVNCLTSPHT